MGQRLPDTELDVIGEIEISDTTTVAMQGLTCALTRTIGYAGAEVALRKKYQDAMEDEKRKI